MDWLLWVFTYFAIGSCFALFLIAADWNDGKDFKIEEVPIIIFVLFLWPIFMFELIRDIGGKIRSQLSERTGKPLGQIVLLRGRMSAKVMNELKKD